VSSHASGPVTSQSPASLLAVDTTFETQLQHRRPKKIDWEDGWANGEKEIVGDL
jgi:hypothetical protein